MSFFTTKQKHLHIFKIFILVENLEVTMNFPNEVPSFETYPIMPWQREVKRYPIWPGCVKVPSFTRCCNRRRAVALLNAAKLLHFFGGDIVVLLESTALGNILNQVASGHFTRYYRTGIFHRLSAEGYRTNHTKLPYNFCLGSGTLMITSRIILNNSYSY